MTEDSGDAFTIILGHHPQNWFTPESQLQLESLLVDNSAIYLHGHEHRILADFGRRGLTSLGFGAVYQDTLDASPTPYYRNSFAVCELDERLHVDIRSWDPENGRWISDQNLPANFDERSEILREGRVLPLPTTLLRDRPTIASGSAVHVMPMGPRLGDCYWLAADTKSRWLSVLEEVGLIDKPERAFEHSSSALGEGHIELRIEDSRGVHRVIRVVSAHGDVVSYDSVVSLNTLLDTETLGGCSVVTLGELADEARTLVSRLGTRKPISAIDRTELLRLWLARSTSPLVSKIRTLGFNTASLSLVITDTSYAIIIADQLRNDWFYVMDGDGYTLDESSELVNKIRGALPVYDRLTYSVPRYAPGDLLGSLATDLEMDSEKERFDRDRYLSRSFEVFDDVRYAPLAALGFRFKSTSLSDIYIQTGADIGGDSKADQGLQRAINEFVESLNLEPSLRDQMETQLRSQYGLSRTAEVGMARRLYQRYGSVVVLGDPGSGKTCFVKHEILAYCKPPSENSSWYERHLPIYVGLSEAAELMRNEDDLLAVCSTVAARSQLQLPRPLIEQHLSDGRAAFFFDGLDEVSRIEERVELLSSIDRLVSQYARYGNRFVLTSRPAAVQPVDIPSAFTYLHLKGLSDQEIRILSERVLTTRLGTSEMGPLSMDERGLIDKLLEHVSNTPGLRRISRNPLLLTLLVLIFANTGSLTARRHLVYTQAVKTLVTVRHRESMDQVLSEADLRTSLGKLAFAIYRREINELPTRQEVVRLLKASNGNRNGAIAEGLDADEFIRRVAESTGILVVHSRSTSPDRSDDVVSFMHYSFLEYYAAVGFLARDFDVELADLATHPHWRDVVTLMFGLRSEHHDVTGHIRGLIDHADPLEAVTNERLLIAFECALECDVPPQSTQNLLAAGVAESLKDGALKHSEQLRKNVCALVDQLVAAAGGQFSEELVVNGIEDENATVSAAFIDFAGRLSEPPTFGPGVIEAFERVFSERREPVVRSACIGASIRRVDLRTPRCLEELGRCLSANLVEKHAALTGMESKPELGRQFHKEVIELLDDPSAIISSSAARCILIGGLLGQEVRKEEMALRKALSIWQGSQRPLPTEGVAVSLNGRELLRMLDSKVATDVELAARLLPLSDLDHKRVYSALIQTIHRDLGHAAVRACLDAFRMREGALELITLAETDFICSLAFGRNRDIRIGAVRVLGDLPYDELVVATLRSFCGIGDDKDLSELSAEEEREGFASLANHARRDNGLQRELVSTVLASLPRPQERRFGDSVQQRRMRSLMFACERVGAVVENRLTNRLLQLARDFRTPQLLRVQALRTFGRTVSPNVGALNELVSLLRRDDRNINEALFAACYWFLGQCRKRVDFVRAVYVELPTLRDALTDAWSREIRRVPDRIDAASVEDIRRSLEELQSVLIAYEDFSDRLKLTDSSVG